jgi:hypothetical protein
MPQRNRLRLGVERLESRRLMATHRFAVIGDYGYDGPNEAAVAALVKSWNPDAVLTVGDNNYGIGAAETIDQNIGKHYQQFIGDYQGQYGPGAAVNRFFPSLGNHDWWFPGIESIQPYLDYFNLPGDRYYSSSGNERYYEFRFGSVQFFALNSTLREPAGVTSTSDQARWLQSALAASRQPFNVVYFHHAPYNSGIESGDSTWMQWPFAEWGVDAVLSGHEHLYERLSVDGIPYFVNGLGGASVYPIGPIDRYSQVRFADGFGAMLITVSENSMVFEFYAVDGGDEPVDSFAIFAAPVPEPAGVVTMLVGAAGVGMLAWSRRRASGEWGVGGGETEEIARRREQAAARENTF